MNCKMGTDVYLEWQGKTEAEDKQQIVGLSIAEGSVGYLRASIGMRDENVVLRMLFADKYWSGSKDEYDFKAQYKLLDCWAVKYLLSVVLGKNLDLESSDQDLRMQSHKRAQVVWEALKKAGEKLGAGPEDCRVHIGAITELRDAITWLNSLYEFFELGVEKQEQGLKPYPYISW